MDDGHNKRFSSTAVRRCSVPWRGGWGPAAPGHTPSTGSTEDPSFSGGCRGGAERGGEGRAGERELRVQVEWEEALRT